MIEIVDLLKEEIAGLRIQNANWIGVDVTEDQLSQLLYAKMLTDHGESLLRENRVDEAHHLLIEAQLSLNAVRLEPLVCIGKRVRDGGKRGHESKYGTEEEKAARHEEYKKIWQEIHRKCPRLSKNVVDEETAKNLDVSKKTIQRSRKIWEAKTFNKSDGRKRK